MHCRFRFQHVRLSEDEAASMVLSRGHPALLDPSVPVVLSYERFLEIMDSVENDAYDPRKKRMHIDEMEEPLSNYFIASSHNTYLSGDQLTGEASVDRYVSALEAGCRCVELQCYDGSDDNGYPIPVVTHGHSFTSSVSFEGK